MKCSLLLGLMMVVMIGGLEAAAQDLRLKTSPLKISPKTPLDNIKEKIGPKGSYDPSNKLIILGSKTPKEAYRFQVSLLAANTAPGRELDGHFCGGSLIRDTWVLTAGHCVTTDGALTEPNQINVYVGSTNFKNGDRIPVKAIYRHAEYIPEYLENDVALLQLSRAPTVPVALISVGDSRFDAQKVQSGAPAKIIGWGITEKGQGSQTLHEASIAVVDRTLCNKNVLGKRAQDLDRTLTDIARDFRIDHSKLSLVQEAILQNAGPLVTENMLCAGDPSGPSDTDQVRDACQGDSGGPIFMSDTNGRSVQIGIVSWGEGCGLPKLAGIYTRLSRYADWIQQTMAPH